MDAQSRCLLCGRRYHSRAKPRYALDAAGAVVGTVHTGCAARHPARHTYAAYPATLAHPSAGWQQAHAALLRQALAPLMREVRTRRYVVLAERPRRLI